MQLSDVINEKYLDAEALSEVFLGNDPFPHVVLGDFIKEELLKRVASEFPNLADFKDDVVYFNNSKEVKFGGIGMKVLSPAALELNTYLQSDLMLNWLNQLTGIEEPLIADPYLSGGGYHEIKAGGLLKIHADFNKHPQLDLDRRLNLLIYLNQEWKDEWGGDLQLYDRDMARVIKSIMPRFNTAVIFSTTSYTYHGHPDPLNCPENRSRKSLAYYYFSTGRPESEVSADVHSTIFKERRGEKFESPFSAKAIVRGLTPPFLWTIAKYLSRR